MLFLGCSSTKINLKEFSPAPIIKSQFAPSKQQIQNSQTLPKVLIMNFDESNIKLAKNAGLGNVLANTLNSALSSSKVVDVVKRVEFYNLKDEVKAAKISKELQTNIGAANYVITGTVDNVTFNSTFFPKNVTYKKVKAYDRNNKPYNKVKKIIIPAYARYESCVNGSVKIYTLPELATKNSYSFSSCNLYFQDTLYASLMKKSDPSLTRKSAQKGIYSKLNSIKNNFSKKGYIFERKINEDKDNIFNITLGYNQGIKEGQTANIYTTKNSFSPLLNEKIKQKTFIGKAVISDQVFENNAWIILEKLNENEVIKIGDEVKIIY
jgi:hypothetical protein